jgi:hypothetical protein
MGPSSALDTRLSTAMGEHSEHTAGSTNNWSDPSHRVLNWTIYAKSRPVFAPTISSLSPRRRTPDGIGLSRLGRSSACAGISKEAPLARHAPARIVGPTRQRSARKGWLGGQHTPSRRSQSPSIKALPSNVHGNRPPTSVYRSSPASSAAAFTRAEGVWDAISKNARRSLLLRMSELPSMDDREAR